MTGTGLIGVVFYCTIALAPVVGGFFLASLFRRRDRLVVVAPVSALIGFFAGGVLGWEAWLPAEWTASFWTTVEAAGNAAKYGEWFEHTAERALMYSFFPAVLGSVAFGLAALFILWRIPVPPSARPVR